MEWRALRDAEQRKAEQQAAAKTAPAPKRVTAPRADRLTYKEKREMESIEQELPRLEARRAEMESELSSGTLPAERLMALSTELGALIEKIDDISMRWLELSEKI